MHSQNLLTRGEKKLPSENDKVKRCTYLYPSESVQ